VVLRNVKISAVHGLTIGYADVSEAGMEIKASEGDPVMNLVGAKILNSAAVNQ
jgi:hypothetical protein